GDSRRPPRPSEGSKRPSRRTLLRIRSLPSRRGSSRPPGAWKKSASHAGRHKTRLHGHGAVLRLEVLLNSLVAALAPDTGVLDSPERGRRVGDHALVEPDHAVLELLHRADRTADVTRVHIGDQ